MFVPILTRNDGQLKSVHVVYTQVEPDIYKGEMFKETFLELNCECYGSEDQAMFIRLANLHDCTGFRYECPIAI